MADDRDIYRLERGNISRDQPDDLGAELPCCDELPADDPCPTIDGKAGEVLLDLLAELEPAERDAAELLDALFGAVETEVSGFTSLVNSLSDELVGAADLVVSEWETAVIKLVMGLAGKVAKEIDQCLEWLYAVGIHASYNTHEMNQFMGGDWLQMLISAVPAVAVSMGYQAGPTTTTTVNEGDTYNDWSGDTTVVSGPVDRSVSSVDDRDTTNNYFRADPDPGVPAPPAPGTTVTCEGANGQPINITVNVPPPPPAVVYIDHDQPLPPPPPGNRTGLPPGIGGTEPPPRTGLMPAPIPNIGGRVDPGLMPPGTGNYQPGQGTTIYVPVPPHQIPRPQEIGPDDPFGIGSTYRPPPVAGPPTATPLAFPIPVPKDQQATGNVVNWGQADACSKADQAVSNPLRPDTPQEVPGKKTPLEQAMESKWLSLNIVGKFKDQFKTADDFHSFEHTWNGSQAAVSGAVEEYADWVTGETALRHVSPQSVPNKAAAVYYGAKLGAAQQIENKTSIPLSYLMTSERYLFQFANPQELPNQVRTDDAYLSGTISDALWECWTKANGNLAEPARRVMTGNQARPDIGDLITLYRRGKLTRDELNQRAREKGVLDTKYVHEWLEASVALPTQSDLVKFMVRDAADDDVAKAYGFDNGFEEKFTPQMEAWARALGLDPKYFRYEWRAHWNVPSYTQLMEMFHRLRPGRPELLEWDEKWGQLGEAAAELAGEPRPPVVTLADVQKAIEVDDYAPAWVRAMVSIGYAPITRTDAVRAYQIGAFDESRLKSAFLDVGYSPASADDLVEFHRQDKARRRANVTGTWSMRKITTYFKRGFLSRDKAAELMRPLTADGAEVERVLSSAEEEMAADTRAAAVKGVRRGLMSGEHSDKQAQALLLGFGVDATSAARLVTTWVMERDTRYKRISAAEAQKMFRNGLIGAEELRQRLINLGYARRDADLIMAKALSVEGGTDGLEAAELDAAIGKAIQNRKEAAKAHGGVLDGRLRMLWNELRRIIPEVNKRRLGTDKPPIPMPEPLPQGPP